MKKNNIAKILLATLSFGLVTTSCDVERLPTGSMASEVITGIRTSMPWFVEPMLN